MINEIITGVTLIPYPALATYREKQAIKIMSLSNKSNILTSMGHQYGKKFYGIACVVVTNIAIIQGNCYWHFIKRSVIRRTFFKL